MSDISGGSCGQPCTLDIIQQRFISRSVKDEQLALNYLPQQSYAPITLRENVCVTTKGNWVRIKFKKKRRTPKSFANWFVGIRDQKFGAPKFSFQFFETRNRNFEDKKSSRRESILKGLLFENIKGEKNSENFLMPRI